jgi:hypothetical protein
VGSSPLLGPDRLPLGAGHVSDMQNLVNLKTCTTVLSPATGTGVCDERRLDGSTR